MHLVVDFEPLFRCKADITLNRSLRMGAQCGCGTETNIQGNDMDCADYFRERHQAEIEDWLRDIDQLEYYDMFINNGFDKMSIIKDHLKFEKYDAALLERIGISKIGHQMVILQSIEKLNNFDNDTQVIPSAESRKRNQKYDDKQPLITCSENQTIPKSDGFQFVEIDLDNNISTWTCSDCQNINSQNASNCLKCNAGKVAHSDDKKWQQRAVNV